MVQGNQVQGSITIFVPRPLVNENRLRRQNRQLTEIVVLMGRDAAIQAFTNHFGVNPLDVCEPGSICELDREQFFSDCSIEEYSQGQNNFVIRM